MADAPGILLATLFIVTLPVVAAALLHVCGIRQAPWLHSMAKRAPETVLAALAMTNLRRDAREISRTWPRWWRLFNLTIGILGTAGFSVGWILAVIFLAQSLSGS